jgi:hypothetical protein
LVTQGKHFALLFCKLGQETQCDTVELEIPLFSPIAALTYV